MKELKLIHGSGGGKKAKKQRAPVEAPNTLQSAATGQILDLLAFGPIKGIVGGTKGVFLDDTPVQNEDGSFNFDGLVFDERHGDPDQTVIDGFQTLANAREINTEIRFDSPVVRAVNNNDASAVIVTIRVPSLLRQDSTTGDTLAHSVPLSIHIQRGSTWYSAVSDTISGKNTAAYERSYRIQLKGEGPFNIRVQRNNRASESSNVNDDIYWSMMTEVVEVRHNYPYCALAGIKVEARLFGNSLPSRKYLTDLSIIQVPSNYDPETRTYSGLWDGTFKNAWTDNPAWCFYDLATHPIIGAGIEDVNKFALYEIGQYCDELVPDGFGGMEPRFTCNTLFSSQEDAISALNTLASVFRGMAYWGSNTVEPVADMPKSVSRIIRPADVIEGEFTYKGTALKERHSVAIVMWNDPEDGYESKPEMVENASMIDLVGWRELRITAVACTSRGQARRLGLWALYSEQHETQTVEFTTTIKNADMRPGDIFQLHDPYRAGARRAGRLRGIEGNKLYLDEVPDGVAINWEIVVEKDDRALEKLTIIGVGEDYVQVGYVPEGVLQNGGFAIVDSGYAMPHFRVVSVSEGEDSVYGIVATEYNPGKYDHIELGMELPDLPESLLPTGQLKAPRSIQGKAYRYLEGNTYNQAMTIGWESSDDARVERYILDIKGPNDTSFRTVYTGLGLSYDEMVIAPGEWKIRVRADSVNYGRSHWAEATVYAEDMLVPSPPTAVYLQMKTMSATVNPSHPFVGQEFEFYRSVIALPAESIESSSVYLGMGMTLEDTDLAVDTEYHYYVRSVNNYGKSTFAHATGRTLADAENILTLLLQKHQESELGQWFQTEIDKISGDAPGSVNDRIQEKIDAIDIADQLGDLDAKLNAIMDLFKFATYDPDKAYSTGDMVGIDGTLYAALKDVPVGVAPPNEEYWERVGAFDGLDDLLSSLAAEVSRLNVSVEEIDGRTVSNAERTDALWSQVNTPMAGDSEENAGSSGTMAGVYSVRQTIADGDSALATRIDTLAVEVDGELRAALVEEAQARADLESSLVQQMTTMVATTNKKSRVFTQPDAPVSSEEYTLQVGDLWFDTSDGNAPYRWSGSSWEDNTNAVITENKAAIIAERTARTDGDSALAQDISALTVEVGSAQAAIAAESVARADDISSLTQQLSLFQSQVEGNYASQEQLNQTKTDLEGAISTQVSTVQAIAQSKNRTFHQPFGPPTTGMVEGDIWYKSDDNNKPHRWNGSVWAVVTDGSLLANVATVQNQVTTLANEQQSQATQITNLQAVIEGGDFAGIEEVKQTTAEINGKLSAMWGVKAQVSSSTGQPVFAGFGLGIEGGVSNFTVKADSFRVVQDVNGVETLPFAIIGGNTVLNSAIIGDATISFAKISDTLHSTNWDATNRTGWRLQKNGNFTIYGGASSEGYIQINNDGVRVYDSSGRLRVKLGKL